MKAALSLSKANANIKGFTLIEIMLVIVIVGLIMSAVQITFSAKDPEQLLKKESLRFAGIFNLAAEYGMLNNMQLALFVTKESYQFLAYDGKKWRSIDDDLFQTITVPEAIELSLQLEDLPIEEPLLIEDALLNEQTQEKSLFDQDDDDLDQNGDQENNEQDSSNQGTKNKKKIVPQVYILSGGEITPFSVSFSLKELLFDLEQDFHYKVTGLYSAPLTIEGPISGSARQGVLDE